LLTGVGLLTTTRPEPYVWARVAGDVLTIATVGAGLISGRSPKRSVAAVLALLGWPLSMWCAPWRFAARRASGKPGRPWITVIAVAYPTWCSSHARWRP